MGAEVGQGDSVGIARLWGRHTADYSGIGNYREAVLMLRGHRGHRAKYGCHQEEVCTSCISHGHYEREIINSPSSTSATMVR